MRTTFITMAALALAGCATTGTQVTADQAGQFEKGTTTYAQVVATLGEPTATSVLSDGTRIVSYNYVHYQTKASTFIPIVGAFAGGASTRMAFTNFTFTPDGVLKDWQTTTSAQGINTGIGAGSSPGVPTAPAH